MRQIGRFSWYDCADDVKKIKVSVSKAECILFIIQYMEIRDNSFYRCFKCKSKNPQHIFDS